MDKHTLISFFDRAASYWDARMVTDDRKIECILDQAGVCAGSVVLDVACLARWVRPGGRIPVAHSMSLDALHRHHAGRAEHVSRPMLSPQELTQLLAPRFSVGTALADEEKYVVSGIRLA